MSALSVCGAEPLTEWAVWGPGWGRAGLGVVHYSREGRIHPQPGDVDVNAAHGGPGLVAWRRHVSPSGMLDFLGGDFPRIPDELKGFQWCGASMYGHTYIHAEKKVHAVIAVESPQAATVWLNGTRLVRDRAVLEKDWNRLLVKSLSPSSVRGVEMRPASKSCPSNWHFGVDVRPVLENTDVELRFSSFDPERRPVVIGENRVVRYYSTFRRTDGQAPLFTEGDSVVLEWKLRVAAGTAENYQPSDRRHRGWRGPLWLYAIDPAILRREQDDSATNVTLDAYPRVRHAGDLTRAVPAAVQMTVYDADNRVVRRRRHQLSFEDAGPDIRSATRRLAMGTLPVGHYTVETNLIGADGTVELRDNDHSFAVIWGPVSRESDAAPRVLATIGQWLLGQPIEVIRRKMHWMHLVGITRQQELMMPWNHWGIRHDGAGNVSFDPNPKIDRVLKAARTYGIDVVGNLHAGYLMSSGRCKRTPPGLTEPQIAEIRANGVDPSHPGQLMLWPYSKPVPPYGTEAFEQTLAAYARAVVSHYADRIDTWSGLNEVDLHAQPNSDLAADVITSAQRILYDTMKAVNPDATYICSSLSRRSDITQKLFQRGYLETCDIIDVHAHPARPTALRDTVIGNSVSQGLGVVLPELESGIVDKPVWYGELSAPMTHSPGGARAGAANLVKQVAWAINNPHVTGLSYLVAYNGPDYAWANGFNHVGHGDPLPAVNAANVASHLLDGRPRLEALASLPADVEHIRVQGADGLDTVVAWAETARDVDIPMRGTEAVVVSLLGKRRTVPLADGMLTVTLDSDPLYVRGRF